METTAATATITSTVDAIVPRLVNATIRNVKYPFEVDDNVKALRLATKELVAKRDDAKTKIENEERQGGRVKKEVSEWMEQVGTIEKEVGVLEQKYQSRYGCLGGFHFNCWSNYTIGKSATKMHLDVQKLCSKGAAYNEMAVTMPAPLPPVQEVPMEPTSSTTADNNLEQALKCINNEPEGVIGLLGMGGVGKTHLLERINNHYNGDSSFDVVILVTVSKEYSIAKIQASIVEQRHLEKNPNEEQQARIIFNFLRVRNFLLLLDDLWEELDLRKVGIPFPLGLGGQYKRKVILTTRSSRVCGQMRVKKEIKVDCLNEEESRSLFRENVSSETLDSHPLIPSLAQKVIDELGGLPLALITIGRAMYGKRDPRDWENAIDQLRAPSSIEVDISNGEESVYQKLKLSYENLKTTRMKECFLSCSMWPEDYRIGRNELIQTWIGLGYIQESNIQKAYNTGHTIITNLLGQCLLEEAHQSNDTGLVKMHDVIRDMAHWIACDFGASKNKWVIKSGLGPRNVPNNIELWRDAECVSFMENNIAELSCSAPLSSPSNLTSLILRSNQLNNISFSENFSYLTRLRFLDLSHSQLSDFPLDICKLVSLQYLDLSYNPIRSIPTELKSLTNLKFLYLRNHEIISLPEGVISELKSLEVLDLCSECMYNITQFEELKRLDNLKALGITVFNLSELAKLEVVSDTVQIRSLFMSKLKDLTSLSSSSLCTTKAQRDLVELRIQFNNLKHFVIEGENPFPNLEKLYFCVVKKLREVKWGGVLPMAVFPRLRVLFISKCCNLKHVTWIVYLPCLQKVELLFCNNMKELVESKNGDQGKNASAKQPTFPSLKSIRLIVLKNLERICDPNHYDFPSLRYLTIYDCPNLRKLPFPNDGILKIESNQVFE